MPIIVCLTNRNRILQSNWQCCFVNRYAYLLPEESPQLDKLSEQWGQWKIGDGGGGVGVGGDGGTLSSCDEATNETAIIKSLMSVTVCLP